MDPTQQPLVSIVIPCYNSIKTLDRLLNSILSQTYYKFEVLLIDDGSIDETLKKCKDFAKKDNRIMVFSKPNEGVSRTRNLGINNAKGEWITFVDADDELKENFLADLIDCVCSNNTDFVIANVCAKNGNGMQTFDLPICQATGIKEIRHLMTEFINHPIIKVNAAKLYRRKIVIENNIRYNERIRLSEDALFVLEYLLHIERLSIINKSGYIYYQPLSLEFKYQLTFEEAIYKCQQTENVLLKLEKKYDCSLSSRNEQNWHKSLSCISLSECLNDEVYMQMIRLYEEKCKSFDILSDYKFNRYLKCHYYLSYNSALDKEDKEKIIGFIKDKGKKDRYHICFSFPKRMLLSCFMTKFLPAKMLNYIYS